MWLVEILILYRARMKARQFRLQELAAVCGISVGVALLFASQVASTSLDSSVRQLTKQIVGSTQYQLDARGPSGFSESLVRQVRSLPGVQEALPLLEQEATIRGPKGQASIDLIGADARFAHIGGPLLRRFSAKQLEHQRAIALPAPIAQQIGVGSLQTATFQIGAHVVQILLGTTLGEGDIGGGLIHSQIALAPVKYAQQLTDMGDRISRIFVKVQPGRDAEAHDALQRVASTDHLNLEPADFDADLFAVASAPAQQGEGLFSAISAFVGFLFAFCAMLLTVPQRRKLIQEARRRGATRTATVLTLMFDATVIGVLACLIGLALGDWLSIHLFHADPGYLSFAFPVGSQRIVTWPTILIAVGGGLAAAYVGVLAPVQDLLTRPLKSAAVVKPRSHRWPVIRIVVGVACLAATTLILLIRPQAAVAGNFTLLAALLVLLPSLFNLIFIAFDRLQRYSHAASPMLAVGELRDPLTRVRSLAVAATGAIAVFGAVSVSGAQHNLQNGLDKTAAEWNRVTNIWISPSGIDNTLGTTAFPVSVASKLTALPGIKAVTIYRGSFLTIGNRRAWVIAPPRSSPHPIPAGQLTDGNLQAATQHLQGHGWAVVSEAIARQLHLHLGGVFTLPAPHPTVIRVAGLSTNGGWPPGAIVMNAQDYAQAWGSSAASALNISIDSGVTPQAIRAEVIRALGPESGLAVQTSVERETQWKTVSRQGLDRLSQIARLVRLAAIIAMAGVMWSLIWQRRERISAIKSQGYSRGQLWRSLLWESAILLGSGCSIGALFGVFGELVISHALATVTGFPITIDAETRLAISNFAIVSLSALAILALPGYLAVRIRATHVKPA
jgi:putative ABC transport system permease protein